MILGIPIIYVLVDLISGRLTSFSHLQWLYYVLSVAASFALWVLTGGVIGQLGPTLSNTATLTDTASGLSVSASASANPRLVYLPLLQR